MAVDMRYYDNIVEQALDMSETHREKEHTQEELRALLSKLEVDVTPEQLKALGRYVELAKWRYGDQQFNAYHPAAT